MSNDKLMAELNRVETECAMVVASVHGVISLALANKLYALREEAAKRGLIAQESA